MGFFTGAMGLAYRGARASLGMRAGVGAAIGGAYGAFSDNTSVFGGAMMGAGAGVALGLASGGLRRGLNSQWARGQKVKLGRGFTRALATNEAGKGSAMAVANTARAQGAQQLAKVGNPFGPMAMARDRFQAQSGRVRQRLADLRYLKNFK